MTLTNTLVDFFKKPHEQTKDETPAGLCPVCWGYQEYDHKIRKLFKDKQIDVNNHRDSYMLIQNFVIHELEGIKLREGKTDSCPVCGKAKEER